MPPALPLLFTRLLLRSRGGARHHGACSPSPEGRIPASAAAPPRHYNSHEAAERRSRTDRPPSSKSRLPPRGRGTKMADVAVGRDKCGEQRIVSLPLSRIRVIMKSSPEVSSINQEALMLTAKATELFVQHLAACSYRHGGGAGKALTYSHLSSTAEESGTFQFLADILPKKILASKYLKMLKEKRDEEENDSSDDSDDDEAES